VVSVPLLPVLDQHAVTLEEDAVRIPTLSTEAATASLLLVAAVSVLKTSIAQVLRLVLLVPIVGLLEVRVWSVL